MVPLPDGSALMPQPGRLPHRPEDIPPPPPPPPPPASRCITSCAFANPGRNVLPVPCTSPSICPLPGAHRLRTPFIVASKVFFSCLVFPDPLQLAHAPGGGGHRWVKVVGRPSLGSGRGRAVFFPRGRTRALTVTVTCTAHDGVERTTYPSLVRMTPALGHRRAVGPERAVRKVGRARARRQKGGKPSCDKRLCTRRLGHLGGTAPGVERGVRTAAPAGR